MKKRTIRLTQRQVVCLLNALEGHLIYTPPDKANAKEVFEIIKQVNLQVTRQKFNAGEKL